MPLPLETFKLPMTASDFMAAALYRPDCGYYRRAAPPWGFRGKDYYTALDLGALLGLTIEARLRRAWLEIDRPQVFTVLEPGAGRGWLGRDILAAAAGDFAQCIKYIHRDDSPAARREAEAALAPWLKDGRASFAAEGDGLPPFEGAVISNELFDALPAQPMRWDGGKWEREVLLVPESPDGPPVPAWEPADPGEAGEWFAMSAEASALQLGDGSVWVASLPGVLADVCAPMRRGLFLTIDYGDTAPRLLAKGAGLRRYSGHTVDGDWWKDPGDSDLTADVDLTRLAYLLGKMGLRPSPHKSLGAWICATAPLAEWEAEWQSLPQEERTARSRNLMHLTLPTAMGERFKVIEAQK